MIFNLALPQPHQNWFKEAMENFWWNWSFPDATTGEAPYKLRGPYWPFSTLVGSFSAIHAINARTMVEPGLNSVEIFPDQLGVSAFIGLDLVDDKRLFCERAVALVLWIAVFIYIEDPRTAGGERGDLCAMFGQSSTAWATGPPERQVRYAVIELLKELGADPDLIKYRNRSALKLLTSPPSLRVGRIWEQTGRAKAIEEFDNSEVGYPPEDHPLSPVKQPHAHDGVYYDTIPADVYSTSEIGTPSGYFFPEVTPPEWPEFLDEFSSSYAGQSRGSWPTVSTLTDLPPIPPHGSVDFTRLVDSTDLGGGQTRRLLYEGEFQGLGDWNYASIPWADNHGYRADLVTSGATPWGKVNRHIRLVYDEAFPLAPPIEVVVSAYDLDWYYMEITVYDASGQPAFVGGGFKGEDQGGGEPLGLTNVWVKGIAANQIGMFDIDKLPLSLVKVKILSTTINIFDEDNLALSVGGGASWILDHYVFPDSLMVPPPPWPATVRPPGNIAIGPGHRGSHPTVKGLRGGRVSGALRLRPI